MVQSGALSAIEINGRVRVTPEAVYAAEQGPLAVKRKVRARREVIDPRVTAMLGEQ
jgi:hypothetical protein